MPPKRARRALDSQTWAASTSTAHPETEGRLVHLQGGMYKIQHLLHSLHLPREERLGRLPGFNSTLSSLNGSLSLRS
eukprot:1133977-Pelagomonas_calceolata.AAC.4